MKVNVAVYVAPDVADCSITACKQMRVDVAGASATAGVVLTGSAMPGNAEAESHSAAVEPVAIREALTVIPPVGVPVTTADAKR